MTITKIKGLLIVAVLLITVHCSKTPEQVDPVEILSASEQAIQQVNNITYDFRFEGTGSMAGSFNGNVMLKKTPEHDFTHTNIQGEIRTGTQTDPLDMTIATRGSDIDVIDRVNKKFLHGNIRDGAGHLLTYGYYAILFQYLQENPFQVAIGDTAGTEWVGRESIDGLETLKVKTVNPLTQADIIWYMSKRDTLPIAQKWIVTTHGVEGEFMFKMSNIKINTPIDTTSFYLTPQLGYKTVNESERHLSSGVTAPDWSLHSLKGDPVHLSKQRGNIVIMDFWASWCPPCWTIMPKLNQLQEEYKGQPVKFYGINTWENPSINIEEYLKNKKIDYEVLLEGEQLGFTYKLTSLPALFVIDQQGSIIYSSNPVRGTPDELYNAIREKIEESL